MLIPIRGINVRALVIWRKKDSETSSRKHILIDNRAVAKSDIYLFI